jgi:hypothetical protein
MKNKQELIDWIVKENSDCGKVLYYTSDSRAAITEEEYAKILSRMKKWELEELIFNHSDEGQKFIEGV